MQVITIEHEAFKRWETLLERAAQLGKEQDTIMTMEEAAEYLRVEKQWVYARRKKIGFFQESKTILFRKSALDKYFNAHLIEPIKKPY